MDANSGNPGPERIESSVESLSLSVGEGHPETGPSALVEILDGPDSQYVNFICKRCNGRVKSIVQGGICVPCDIEQEVGA